MEGEHVGDAVVRVRGRSSVLRTAVIALAVALVPVSIALYVVTEPVSVWPFAASAEALAVGFCVVLGFRQRALVTEVDATELRGNGVLSPMEHVPLERIAHVHLVPIFVGDVDVVHQLLVTDAHGARLFRMRGNYWQPGALDAVAEALPVPVDRVVEPMSMQEFWATYPGSAYWFENRRPLVVVVSVVVVLAVIAAALLVRTLA